MNRKSLSHADIVARFAQAAGLAGVAIPAPDIEIEFLSAPHTPPASLPRGKSAVYVFMFGDRCLKVGKAGPKSAARFCSQHYGVDRAPSTLARSVVKAQLGGSAVTLNAESVSAWLCNNTTRINFLLPSSYGPRVLSLLESFVQCCLRPEFEGFASQEGEAITKKRKLERRVMKGDLAKYKNEWHPLDNGDPIKSHPIENNPKVLWHESSAYPDDWGSFGHGIHFHDSHQRRGKDLVAFIEGFEWLHSRSAVVQGYHVKPDSITTDGVLSAMKRRIEQIVSSQEFKGVGKISRRISAIANA